MKGKQRGDSKVHLCRTCKEEKDIPINKYNRKDYQCFDCNNQRMKDYYDRNPDQKIKSNNRANENLKKLRKEIIEHYSKTNPPSCAGCKEKRYLCLEIDHINNDGEQHKKKLSGYEKSCKYHGYQGAVYRDIKRQGFPSGYQILCANCNRIKRLTKGKKDKKCL